MKRKYISMCKLAALMLLGLGFSACHKGGGDNGITINPGTGGGTGSGGGTRG
jgi:hypothetical protein